MGIYPHVGLHSTKKNIYLVLKCSPSLSSSIWPCISSSKATAVTSSSLTNPLKLHEPRHRRACVDATESQLHVCERIRHPWLKSCLTSTEVAVQPNKIGINRMTRSHTGYGQV